MEYLVLLVPVAGLLVARIFFPRRMAWWEWPVLFLPALLLIFGCKGCAEWQLTRDTEYWGGVVAKVRHENEWQEEVPCRHPVYCQRPVTTTDSKGNTSTTLESYQCGTEHTYDVDTHPPFWRLYGSNGERIETSEGVWQKLCTQFHNVGPMPTGHTSVHLTDGGAWETVWPGARETAEPLTTEHEYENRVQASRNVVNFPEVTPEQQRRYGLHPYPNLNGYYYLPALLPSNYDDSLPLDRLNGLLGAQKQIRVWVLLFPKQPREAGILQEAFWKGGNKNELVLCVGLDPEQHITWAHVFSWTPAAAVKIQARDWLQEQDRLDPAALATFLEPLIAQQWKRKHFKEFKYLAVEMTPPQFAWLWVLTLLATGGYLFFVATNACNPPEPPGASR